MAVVDDPPDVLIPESTEREVQYASYYDRNRDRFLQWCLDRELDERFRHAPAPTRMAKGGR